MVWHHLGGQGHCLSPICLQFCDLLFLPFTPQNGYFIKGFALYRKAIFGRTPCRNYIFTTLRIFSLAWCLITINPLPSCIGVSKTVQEPKVCKWVYSKWVCSEIKQEKISKILFNLLKKWEFWKLPLVSLTTNILAYIGSNLKSRNDFEKLISHLYFSVLIAT